MTWTKCKTCHGKGSIPYEQNSESSEFARIGAYKCQECDGDGHIYHGPPRVKTPKKRPTQEVLPHVRMVPTT